MTDKKSEKISFDDLEGIKRYLQWWDPINAIEDNIEAGHWPNEYDSYARDIFHLLRAKSGKEKLIAHLQEIRNGMSQKPDPARDRFFADALIAFFKNEFEPDAD
jgi:hypothetical protein